MNVMEGELTAGLLFRKAIELTAEVYLSRTCHRRGNAKHAIPD